MGTFDLTDFFTTRSEGADFSARIANIANLIYKVDFDLERELVNQFGIRKKDKFMTILRDSEIPIESKPDLGKFFDLLRGVVSSTPTITLTLAIEPNEEILKTISEWFVLNLKKQVLLDIQVYPEIIAGAGINYQGKYHNGSIKPIFEKVLMQTFNVNPNTSAG